MIQLQVNSLAEEGLCSRLVPRLVNGFSSFTDRNDQKCTSLRFWKYIFLMTAVNHLLSFSDKHLLCLVWLVGNYIGFDSLRTKIFLELEITHTSTKCLGICGFSCLMKFCFVFFILRSCKQLFVMLYLPRFNFYFERKLNKSFLCVKTATRVKRGTSVKNHVFASSTRNTSWTLWCEGSGAWWVAWLVLTGTVQLCIKFW